ncbi:MAG: NUDIX domain-containing protein [Trueperaceae bacterium]
MAEGRERAVFRGRIVDLVVLDERWEVVRHAPAVAVLARDGGGRVLGVVQRRPAVGARTWELPAGLIDPGETAEAAAARELAEEANLAGTLRLLAAAYVSPGFTDELVHLFEARDLHHAAGTLDDGEELEVEWRAPQDVWDDAARGALATSMVTLLGLRHALAADAVRRTP